MSDLRQNSTGPLRDVPHYVRVFYSIVGARMYLVLMLGMFAALADGFGIVMLLPLLQSLDGMALETGSGALSVLTGFIDRIGISSAPVLVISVIGLVFIAKALFLFFAQGYAAYLQVQMARELRLRLYDEYSNMRLEYYVSRSTGHFINLINKQVDGFVMTFLAMINLGKAVAMTIVYITAGILIAWQLGMMAILVGAALFWPFQRLSTYVRALSRRTAAEDGKLNKLLIQSLQSFKYLASTGGIGPLRKATAASIKRLSGFLVRNALARTFTTVVREPVVVLTILAVVVFQIAFLKEPLAPILISLLLFYRGLNGLMSLQAKWQNALAKIGAVEMVQDELSSVAEHRERDGFRELGPLDRDIELRGVHFAYGADGNDVLDEVSLRIPARSSVAFVGRSGSGKSTLIDLVTLMLKPRKGKVLIDGVPGEQVRLSSWRKQIGFVSQETVIFDDTVANNISLWAGNVNEDPLLFERVRDAARMAHVADVIDTLPDGYNTLVGDRGVRLSGGQRQRLFLARELFKKPSVLILDEATSALDSESENQIQKSIDSLKGSTTIIMVAHRLSTIRNVDKIFVLDNGHVVEEGEYAVLRNDRQSSFSRLVNLQQL